MSAYYSPGAGRPDGSTGLPQAVLRRLLTGGAVPADGWDALDPADRERVAAAPDLPALADALTARRLVTPFQAGRIKVGNVAGLVLGNYRLLEKVGAGGMGVVYRAEHVKLKQPAAVKALVHDGRHRRGIDRFFLEVRAVATLRHPNIVAAIDAGEEPQAGPDGQAVPYLVMEYVPGRNLDDQVTHEGPLPPHLACQHLHQIADALTEAHRHGLVHRDIKPSNVIVTPDGRAKLLDFGVARLPNPDHRLTQDGAKLGTVGYMAPEQARNPRDVDARADVFGLAATLFYALTGQDPFPPPHGSLAATAPPDLSRLRADLPPGLAAAVARMLALDPAARVPSAAAAMRELAAFRGFADGEPAGGPISVRMPAVVRPVSASPPRAIDPTTLPGVRPAPVVTHRVLIVDDEEPVRRVARLALQHEPVACDEVGDGPAALAQTARAGYDLVLLDVDLPGLNGELVLRRLRASPPSPHLKVVMLSGRTSGDDLSRLLAAGADDYLTKPFSVVQLRGRVKAALRLKDAQDRSDALARQLTAANARLEAAVSAKADELVHARSAMVLAMARLVEQRSTESGGHLLRLQRYCRVLAEGAAGTPAFAGRLDPDFVTAVESAAPLHDIGKVAVPDAVLNKPAALTPDERRLMQGHTTAGADTLAEVAARYPLFAHFFGTAVEIARSHHERWDGTGYPHRLAGEAIPLSARLVAVGDVYDALRSRRVYKSGLSHPAAVEQMVHNSPGHFDPALLAVFQQVAPQFDRVFRETED
jgi:response regulator RpfG family c-di-GMP phosphodiesterase